MEKKSTIVKSTLVVFAAMILAKLAALVEDAVLASMLGTTELADAYYISADIVQLFWYFGTLGISRVFLPEYKSQLLLYGEAEAETYGRNMLRFFTLFAILITGILVVFAGPLSGSMAFGFTAKNKALVASYVRYRTPQIVFWCWTWIFTSKLQSKGKFFASKLPEILIHIPVIVFSLLWFQKFGMAPIFWGLFTGSVLGFLSQLLFTRAPTRSPASRALSRQKLFSGG